MTSNEESVGTGDRIRWSFQALTLFFATLVGASVAVQALSGVITGSGTVATVATTIAQFLAFGVVVALFLAAGDDWGLLDLAKPTRRDIGIVLGSVVVLFAVQYGLLTLLSSIGVVPVENQAIDPDAHAPNYFLAMVAVSVLFVGPAEELLFRGAIQGLLKRAFGVWPAIVVAAALFGSVHFTVGAGSLEAKLAYVTVAFILGGLLGYLYERTENLVVPALAHGGFNAVAFFIQYLAVAGF